MSLRATGEGHISSITFRSGVVSAQHRITLVPPAPFVTEPERAWNATYEQPLFRRKLAGMGVGCDFCWRVMDQLPEHFTMPELQPALDAIRAQADPADPAVDRAARGILLLAESNYELAFTPSARVSQRAIFPHTPSQRNGIEDARFVRFQHEDGAATYYATYTAYDGRIILPQLLETPDFEHFRFSTLNGPAVRNKGMALFPRRVNGLYAMLSRQDDESLFLRYSEHPHFWYEPKVLLSPQELWELLKPGNCGSPIETEAGWLVLSHGAGPMRKYCLGAFLLDIKDPGRVIGRLRMPLLSPNELEREGYVPNVVYTCGALVHRGVLILPYAMSDSATNFATVPLADLLAAMVGLVWMFAAILIISTFTAAITSVLTVSQIGSPIRGPGDLPGVRVATVASSTGEWHLKAHQITDQSHHDVLGALQALMEGRADAVVYDAPS